MLLLALGKFPNGEEAKSEKGKKEKRRNGKPAGPSTEGLLKVLAPDFTYLISINSGISPWTHLGGNTNTTALCCPRSAYSNVSYARQWNPWKPWRPHYQFLQATAESYYAPIGPLILSYISPLSIPN